MINNKAGFVFALLLGLPLLSHAQARDDASRHEELVKKAQAGFSVSQPSQRDETAYQESRERYKKRQRERHKQLVADMKVSPKESKEVLAILETVLQARLWLSDYLRTHRGVGMSELVELAQQSGNSDLADAVAKINPGFAHERIRNVVGQEKSNRYRELLDRRHAKGRKGQ